jgi:uncharacterized membrane protein YfhO
MIRIELPLKDESNYANINFVAFTMNEDVFIEGYNKLKSGQIEYTKFNDTEIVGSFVAENNEILYTSIPYDEGWTVCIDGKEINKEDLIKISDALLGIKVSSGQHKISLKYSIPYMKIASIISILFVIFLLVMCFMKKKKLFIFKNSKQNIWEKLENITEDIIIVHKEKSVNIIDTKEKADNQDNLTE